MCSRVGSTSVFAADVRPQSRYSAQRALRTPSTARYITASSVIAPPTWRTIAPKPVPAIAISVVSAIVPPTADSVCAPDHGQSCPAEESQTAVTPKQSAQKSVAIASETIAAADAFATTTRSRRGSVMNATVIVLCSNSRAQAVAARIAAVAAGSTARSTTFCGTCRQSLDTTRIAITIGSGSSTPAANSSHALRTVRSFSSSTITSLTRCRRPATRKRRRAAADRR